MATLPFSRFKPLWGVFILAYTFLTLRRKTTHEKAWQQAQPFQRLFAVLTSTWVKPLYRPTPPVFGSSFSA